MGLSEKHIAPLVLGGIIAAGASLAGNAIGASSQNKTNQTSIDINNARPTSNIMCMITHVFGGFNTELGSHLG